MKQFICFVLALALLGAWMAAYAVDRVYLRQPTPLGDRPPEHLVTNGWYGNYRSAQGSALYVTGAPVTMRNTRFVANQLSHPYNGGTVCLVGNCGGSAFVGEDILTVTTSRPASSDALTANFHPPGSLHVTSAVPAFFVATVAITRPLWSMSVANANADANTAIIASIFFLMLFSSNHASLHAEQYCVSAL